jgi:hypothetical protein
MKVVKIDDEETKLTKRQQQKVAILKLTANGKYIENVGIRDNEFFLLTEGEDDEEYLAFMQHSPLKGGVKTTADEVSRLTKLLSIGVQVAELKEQLSGGKESNREVGESPSS